MPSLDELRERLHLKAGDLITEEWYDDLVTYLKAIEKGGAVDYGGYVHSDLIPDTDAIYNLGSSNLRFNNIHAVKGEFSEDLKVQGKRVIKDEDPIHIASFFDYAKQQITESIIDALLNLGIPPKPELIAYKIDYYASEMTDVFDPDVIVKFNGRVRIKVTTTSDAHLYLKHIANAVGVEVTSLLTATRKNTWIEKDFTVNKDDKVNVSVLPSCKISIYIYNIPEA